jgi:hypothetical protein
LAAFPAFFAFDRRDTWYVVSFATFSIAVMLFWTFVAERHRAFQQRAMNAAQFLEEYALGEETMTRMRAAARSDVPDPKPSVRAARLGLLATTVVLWVLLLVLSLGDALPVTTR